MNAVALREIGTLLDNKCSACETRKKLDREYGRTGHYAKIDGYCNRECDIGRKLQDLGRRL